MVPSKRKVGKHLFKAVLLKNRSFHSDNLTLKISKIGQEKAKLSVVVPKKVEKTAVNRNLTKRRIYNLCRHYVKDAELGAVCIVFVKKSIKSLLFSDLKVEIEKLFQKTGISPKIEL